jgi:hypothetical protein
VKISVPKLPSCRQRKQEGRIGRRSHRDRAFHDRALDRGGKWGWSQVRLRKPKAGCSDCRGSLDSGNFACWAFPAGSIPLGLISLDEWLLCLTLRCQKTARRELSVAKPQRVAFYQHDTRVTCNYLWTSLHCQRFRKCESLSGLASPPGCSLS